jgi:hypothetical protein
LSKPPKVTIRTPMLSFTHYQTFIFIEILFKIQNQHKILRKKVDKKFYFLSKPPKVTIRTPMLSFTPYQTFIFIEILFKIQNQHKILRKKVDKNFFFVKTPKNNYSDPHAVFHALSNIHIHRDFI